MLSQYLVREAGEQRASRLKAAARRQAAARKQKGQLSVLIDQEVLKKWRVYVADRRGEGEESMTAAEILEELLERELRRKKRW